MDMIEWFRPMGGDSGEMDMVKMPARFEWINKPVTVIGEDFTYEAICLCAFPKSNGKVRYIVEDRGRLFIQRESQLQWHDEPNQTIGEALELHHNRVLEGMGPKPEDPVTLAVLDDMDNERAGRPSRGCPHCGYFHPPDGMCI